jgi:uncharacterized RDD family membrane protein YckC
MTDQAAGFWRRFAARLVDWILTGIAAAILGRPFGTSPQTVHGSWIEWVISFVYFTALIGGRAQTLGDAALGIRVVDVRDVPGEPIGYGRAAIRWLVAIPSGALLALGYLWMLWDPKKQTWHDKAAGSLPIIQD